MNKKWAIFGAALAVLLLLNIWYWIWGREPRITLNVTDAPIAEIVRAYEKQGHIKIATNLPADTKATIRILKAPVPEALETLAAEVDGTWNVTYLFGKNDTEIRGFLTRFQINDPDRDWRRFGFRGGMLGFEETEDLEVVADPRPTKISVETKGRPLQEVLAEVGPQSTAMMMVQQAWNPATGNLKAKDTVPKIAKQIASKSGGKVQEVILMSTWRGRRESEQRTAAARTEGEQRGDGGMNPVNRMVANGEARITTLPPEQQPAAREQLAKMQALMQEMEPLTPEQRREKMREYFSQPENIERMEERRAVRDSRTSPEKRQDRYRRYIERKREAQSTGT